MFIVYVVISLFLLKIPVIRGYFEKINILIHESGHFITSIFLNCKIGYIRIENNKDSEAIVYTNNRLKKIIIALSGYMFSSLIALLFIYLIYNERQDLVGYSFLGLLVINLFFWVRNLFGIVWIISFVSLLSLSYISKDIFQHFVLFIVACHLVDSILSTITLLRITINTQEESSDSHNLSSETSIPPLFYSVFFFLFTSTIGVISFPYWI